MVDSRISNNPWKGLNFYIEGEVLYGRDNEIESLSQYIINNTQTVLYGKSGIGKSSILNAGVFPIARRNGLIPISIRLDHNSSTTYISQIYNAIINSGVEINELLPSISKEHESLWEFFHRNTFNDKDGNQIQLLLVFDQFEEIFTLQSDEKKKRDFFDSLAGLINDVTPLYIVNSNEKEGNKSHNDEIEIADDLTSFDINIEDTIAESSTQYLQRVDYHMVFTLREDFLSYFERYTKYIPAMKSNRYALLPINVAQAKEIILKPVEGLVDVNVANLIIQKVTGRKDIRPDDEQDIEVDSAMLSLYLSRLFIKKGQDNVITSKLVNEFSEVIIKDFYEEAVENLPSTEIERLEDQLLTYDGRRNNVSFNDLLREGISRDVIFLLTEDRKILRQFNYQGDIRVEFIHDKLCSIVNERLTQREENKKRQEEIIAQQQLLEQEKLKAEKYRRKMKRNRWQLYALLLLIALALPLLLFFINQETTYKECQLLLAEDETVGIDNYWKAEVVILNEKSDTLYPTRILDKTNTNTTYSSKGINNVRIVVHFLAGNFSTIDTLTQMGNLASITIPISRAHGRNKYEGKIISGAGSHQPLNDAVVIIGGQITKTNYKGSFVAYVDKSDISDDGSIKVFKTGYRMLNTKLIKGNHEYVLQPEDSRAFKERLRYIQEKVSSNGIVMEGLIGNKYSSHLTVSIEKDSVFGLFYFDRTLMNAKKKEDSYILFSGKLNSDNSFHLDCCDDAYNLQELNGTIDENGVWEGYWHSYSHKLEKFRFTKIGSKDEE